MCEQLAQGRSRCGETDCKSDALTTTPPRHTNRGQSNSLKSHKIETKYKCDFRRRLQVVVEAVVLRDPGEIQTEGPVTKNVLSQNLVLILVSA